MYGVIVLFGLYTISVYQSHLSHVSYIRYAKYVYVIIAFILPLVFLHCIFNLFGTLVLCVFSAPLSTIFFLNMYLYSNNIEHFHRINNAIICAKISHTFSGPNLGKPLYFRLVRQESFDKSSFPKLIQPYFLTILLPLTSSVIY